MLVAVMPLVSKEVVLGDLHRLKILLQDADAGNHFNIVPKGIENLIQRYKEFLRKWKKTHFHLLTKDTQATRVVERENITLQDGLQPVT